MARVLGNGLTGNMSDLEALEDLSVDNDYDSDCYESPIFFQFQNAVSATFYNLEIFLCHHLII